MCIRDRSYASRHDLRAYEVGGNLSYMGFTVGGSYGDMGESRTIKSIRDQATNVVSAVSGKKDATCYTCCLLYTSRCV